MQTLETRLSRLEIASNPQGPLLISWRFDANARATTTFDGKTYSQAAGESRDQFLRRVASSVPRRMVVWLNELDEAL